MSTPSSIVVTHLPRFLGMVTRLMFVLLLSLSLLGQEKVRINEFMAGNTNSIPDEDGEFSDWIELHNSGTAPVNLTGWFLTDDDSALTKWRLPSTTLAANSYLLIYASGKDRTNGTGRMHTNFGLKREDGYLALVKTDGRTIASEFAPHYPKQYSGVAYGLGNNVVGPFRYLSPATPGAQNGAGFLGVAPPPVFSLPGGIYTNSLFLSISANQLSTVVRFTTNGTTPTAGAAVFPSRRTISNNTVIRARTFLNGYLPSDPVTHTYLINDPALKDFTSNLPLVVLASFGKTIIPDSKSLVSAILMEPFRGRSSLTAHVQYEGRAGVAIRGSSSSGFSEKQYSFELMDETGGSEDGALLGMPPGADWVLFGAFAYDPGMVRNQFAYELSNQIGRYAPRTRNVELYLNQASGGKLVPSNYLGISVLVEKPKVGPDRIDIDPLRPGTVDAETLEGGYVLKIDRLNSGETGLTAGGQVFAWVHPKEDVVRLPHYAAQRQYITTFFNDFKAALDGPNSADPNIGYAKYLDVDAAIDHHLINTLTKNVDALRLSTYLYKPRGKKFVFGPVWDFDRALNSTDGRDDNPSTWNDSGGTEYFKYIWWDRLFLDPNFSQKWIDRWFELREGAFSTTNMNRIIDTHAAELTEAQKRHVVRFPNLAPRGGSYAAEINLLKDWLLARSSWMDGSFLARPVLTQVKGPTGASEIALTAPAGSVIYYTLNGSDPRLPGGNPDPNAFLYTSPFTVTNNVRIFARTFGPNSNAAIMPGSTAWSAPRLTTLVTESPKLTITELMYHPASATPPALPADAFEFIELKNVGSKEIDLTGFRLRGGIHFDFPGVTQPTNTIESLPQRGTIGSALHTAANLVPGNPMARRYLPNPLAPGQYAILVRNRAAFESRYGMNHFIVGEYSKNLGNDTDKVRLEGPLHEPLLDFSYRSDWYPITDGFGFSLVIKDPTSPPNSWGDPTRWRASAKVGGSPSAIDPEPLLIQPILIEEVLSRSTAEQVDAIELQNPNATSVDVSGWYLTDTLQNVKKFRFPDGSIVPSKGYLRVDETEFNKGKEPFALSSKGDAAFLFSGNPEGDLSGYFHGYKFGASDLFASLGRHRLSTGDFDIASMDYVTLGSANSLPRVGPVVISEIMYRPQDVVANGANWDNDEDEYVELQNLTEIPFPLSGSTNAWELGAGVSFSFATNTLVSPKGFLLVVGFNPVKEPDRLKAFRTKYKLTTSVPVVGPWKGKLSNTGEAIQLTRSDPEVGRIVVDHVSYQTQIPWPADSGGNGKALLRRNNFEYGNDPANWTAATPTPGAANPGAATIALTSQPRDLSVSVGGEALLSVTAQSPDPLTYQWRFNGFNLPGATASTLRLSDVQPSQVGDYTVVVSNTLGGVNSRKAVLSLLVGPLDSDQDGLPDDWEVEHGFDPKKGDGANGADDDFDRDGLTNFQEFLAGTHPKVASSHLRITSLTQGAGQVSLTFNAISGRKYRVEFKDHLEGSEWMPGAEAAAATEGPLVIRDPAPSGKKRFYRLVLVP